MFSFWSRFRPWRLAAHANLWPHVTRSPFWRHGWLWLLLLVGCQGQEATEYQPQYANAPLEKETVHIFGVHPLHNPERLFEVYQPLVDYINRHITGGTLKLEASRNYAAFERKLYAGEFHLALPNPYQVITSLNHDYRVFGKMGDDHNFRGIILVRRDSGIREITHLKGKAISFPPPPPLWPPP